MKADLQANGIKEMIDVSAEHSININALRSKLEEKLPNQSIKFPDGK